MELLKKDRINLAAGSVLALFLLPTILSNGSSASASWMLAFTLLALLLGGGLVVVGFKQKPPLMAENGHKSHGLNLVLVSIISLMIGGVWAASGLLIKAPAEQAGGMPSLLGFYPILILILVLGIGLNMLLAAGLRSVFSRWGRQEMVNPILAVLAAIIIPVMFSLTVTNTSTLMVLVALIGIIFSVGLVRPALLTLAARAQNPASWGLVLGLQIGLFELGNGLFLLAAGSVPNFSIFSPGLSWAAACGLFALFGSTALLVIAAVRSKKV